MLFQEIQLKPATLRRGLYPNFRSRLNQVCRFQMLHLMVVPLVLIWDSSDSIAFPQAASSNALSFSSRCNASFHCSRARRLKNRRVLKTARRRKSKSRECTIGLLIVAKTFIWKPRINFALERKPSWPPTSMSKGWRGGCSVKTVLMLKKDCFSLWQNGFVGSVGCTLLKSTPTVLAKPAQLADASVSKGLEVREHRCPECNYRTPKELMLQQRWFCIVD